jgi:catechol 2,3-dioxygenase-like lactoylglutathione lyase family enzyme
MAFFVHLGLEVEDRTFGEGEFIDTVIGMPGARTEIVMLRPPDGGAGVEHEVRRARPRSWIAHSDGQRAGSASICFEVDDLQAAVDGLAANGYGLVGGIGQHENTWRMAHVRGPEGIVVSLTERID